MGKRRLGTLVVVAALGISACGGDDDSEAGDVTDAPTTDAPTTDAPTTDAPTTDAPTTDAPTTGAPTTDAPTTDAPTTDAPTAIDRDATVTYTWSTPVGTWDPARVTNIFGSQVYYTMVYDRLIQLGADGDLHPQLATEWSTSDDGTVITFTVRDDAVFHDGTPVDAGAIVASIDRQRTLEGSAQAGRLASIASIEAPDATTVVITLSAPDPTIMYELAWQSGAVLSPSAIADDAGLELNPAGSGPYRLVESSPELFVFERNEDYFDPDVARAARIEILPIGDATARLNAVRSGQADIGQFGADQYAELSDLAAGDDFDLYSYSSSNTAPIYLNTGVAPLDDPRVRLALNLAIDRESINDNVMSGQCMPAGQTLPEGIVGHDPSIEGYPFDPERARELLDEAGVGEFTIEGISVELEPYNSISQIVADMLSDIGVTIEFTAVEPAAMRATWREGNAAAAGFAISVTSPDPSALFDAIMLSVDNPGGQMPDDTFAADAEVAKALPLGSDERDAAYQDLNRRATENPTHIRVCALPNIYLYRTGIVGADEFAYSNLSPIGEPVRLGMAG
jgi:peptide/nickel transport system substrate-binding protein